MLKVLTGDDVFRPLVAANSSWFPEGLLIDSVESLEPFGQWLANGLVFTGPICLCLHGAGFGSGDNSYYHVPGFEPLPVNSIPVEGSPLLDAISILTNGIRTKVAGVDNPCTHIGLRGTISNFSLESRFPEYHTPYYWGTRRPGAAMKYRAITIPRGYASYSLGHSPTGGWFHLSSAGGPYELHVNTYGVLDAVISGLQQWPSSTFYNTWNMAEVTTAVSDLEFDLNAGAVATPSWQDNVQISYLHDVLLTSAGYAGTLSYQYRTSWRIQCKLDLYEDYGPWVSFDALDDLYFGGPIRKMLAFRIVLKRELLAYAATGDLIGTMVDHSLDAVGPEIRPQLYISAFGTPNTPTTQDVHSFYLGSGSVVEELAIAGHQVQSQLSYDRYAAFADAYTEMENSLDTNFIETVLELRELSAMLPDLTPLILAYKHFRTQPWLALKDIASLLTGTHLYLQFGLLPNLNAANEVRNIASVLASADGTLPDRIYGFHSGSATVLGHVCEIQTRVRVKLAPYARTHALLCAAMGLNRAGLFPSLSALWDTIPLSFVADWVFHIGDKISQFEAAASLAVLPIENYVITHKFDVPLPVPSGFTSVEDVVGRAFYRGVMFQAPPPSDDSEPVRIPPVGGSLLFQVLS